MHISQTMIEILQEIKDIEPSRKTRGLDQPNCAIGSELIDIYYSTETLRTRELIMSFMDYAGFDWVRRLIMRDVDSQGEEASFSSLDEYTMLAASNDPTKQWERRNGN